MYLGSVENPQQPIWKSPIEPPPMVIDPSPQAQVYFRGLSPTDIFKLEEYNTALSQTSETPVPLIEYSIAQEVGSAAMEFGSLEEAIGCIAEKYGLKQFSVLHIYRNYAFPHVESVSNDPEVQLDSQIMLFYDEGYTRDQIAEHLSLTFAQLHHRIDRLIRKGVLRGRLDSEEYDSYVLEMCEQGYTYVQIAKRFGVSEDFIKKSAKRLQKHGLMKSRATKYEINYDFFDMENIDPEFAYMIGLFIADGHKRKDNSGIEFTLELGDSERTLLDYLRLRTGGAYTEDPRCESPYVRLAIYRHEIAELFDSLGFSNQKDTTARIPDIFFEESNKQFLPAIVRGIYDGDGTKAKRGKNNPPCARFTTSSYNLITQLSEILQSQGIQHSVNIEQRSENEKPVYKIKIGYSNLFKFHEYIYPSQHVIGLQRKKEDLEKCMLTPYAIFHSDYKPDQESTLCRMINLGFEGRTACLLKERRKKKKEAALLQKDNYTQLDFLNMV